MMVTPGRTKNVITEKTESESSQPWKHNTPESFSHAEYMCVVHQNNACTSESPDYGNKTPEETKLLTC
jgi:hypothetical protein